MASKSTVSTTIQLLGKLDPSVSQAFDKAQSLASKAGSGIGKAMSAGFKMAGTAAKAFGAAVAATTAYAIKLGTEYQSASGQIAAATGATGAELEGLQGVMQEVYGGNYGDSMEDVASAVATVKQQMQGLSNDGLQSVTEGAFVLRDTFQYDISESVRAANALVKNFGIDGDQAMNLIATGAQNGLDFSGELLDTISEYSGQFAKVGIDADQMFQIMQAGADSGAWNLDKVGDAIKEMTIRVVDGSETTAQGFAALGMDADTMAQKFAAGGESAQEAFSQTISALADMEDPVQQNIAGVNLFGTMWEDLGPEVVTQLASITDEAYSAGDELSKMSEVKYDNLGDAVEGLKRSFEVELMPLANELTSFLTDMVQSIDLSGLSEKLTAGVQAAFEYIMPIVQPLIQPLKDLFTGLFSGDMFSGFSSFIQGLQGPLIMISQAIAPLITGFMSLAQQVFPILAQVGQVVATAFAQLLAAVSPLVQSILPPLGSIITMVAQAFISLVNLAMPPITAFIQFITPAFQGLMTILQSIIDFIVNVFTGNWSAAWSNVTSIFGTIWGGIVGLVKGPINAVIGIINSAIGAINSISVTILDWVPLVGGQTLGFNIPAIPMLATGGTITEPMLAVVGDAPETIVPHGDTPRNRALLGEAAAGVGASVGGTVVNFNATITGGNAEDVRQGILEAEDEFERRMDAYFARKARVSFA